MTRIRTAPKKKAKQARSRATVEAILTAAARLLVRDGFDRTSTTRIADVAGVSIGSLYQYFPGKEAIVAELIDRHVGKMFALVENELAALGAATLPVAVKRVVELFFRAYTVDPRLRRVFIEQVPRIGRLERLHDLESRLAMLVRAYLEAHRREVDREDLDAAAFVLMRAVAAVTYAATIERTRFPPEKLIDEVASLVLRYLGASHK